MKRSFLVLAVSLAAFAAGAANLIINKEYLMVPLSAGSGMEPKYFITADNSGSLSFSATFSDEAVWKWGYVSGTAGSTGHYSLKNPATGKYLFSIDGEEARCSSEPERIVCAASSVNEMAHTFKVGGEYLTLGATDDLLVSAEEINPGSSFLMIDYNPELSAEDILQQVSDAVVVANGIQRAIDHLLPMLEASYTGTRQAERVLSVLYYSQTTADIQTQLVEVRRTAVRMLESDLENGATWQQKATSLYIADIDGTPQAVEAPTAEGIWYGQFTDNGNTIVEGREFRLYNNQTKSYLLVEDGRLTTSKDEGTLWTVAYYYGSGLAIAPADDPSELRLYPGADLKLTLGKEMTQSLVYVGEVNLFGEGVNSVKPIGATAEEAGQTVFTSINAIELTVEHGAIPAADGELTLTLTDDSQTTTLATVAATAAKDPTTKTIEVDYYDSTGTRQTGTREVDIYTIALDETYTDGGEYIVRVNMGAFTLNGALSREMAGFSTLAVSNQWAPVITPGAGIVDAVTSIGISGPDGVYVNPKAGDNTVDLNCDGNTLKSLEASQFAEGGEFDSYNPADPSGAWFTISVDFKQTGRYSIFIPRGFFIDNNGAPCAEASAVWEIDEAGISSVKATDAASDGATYDLLGRRATKGLLITKGRKQIIR